MREEIFQYVKKKYKVEPDYPFSTAPTYPVLRHKDNRKWFALIMDIPREKLGLEGSEHVDIMNVKLGDPMLVDMIVRQLGYFCITLPEATGSPFSWTERCRLRRSVSGSMRATR